MKIVLSVFLLCACGIVPTNKGYSLDDAGTMTPPFETSSLAPPAVAGHSSNDTRTSQPSSSPDCDTSIASLRCTDYLETQWGTGAGEFGVCPATSEAWIRGPYSPVLNGIGDLYILDKANLRILRYSGGATPKAIPIPRSYLVGDVCDYSNHGWPNLSASQDRLFFQFSVWKEGRLIDQLAVLTAEGQEEQVIDLEAYYPLHSLLMSSLTSDRKGGVYLALPPAGVVHFDAELRPEFVYLGIEGEYENMVVGWDYNLYTYSVKHDRLDNWGTDYRLFAHGERLSSINNVIAVTPIVSPTFTSLLGADARGWLYFLSSDHSGDSWIVRVSASGDKRAIAEAPDGWSLPSVLAPDGMLYGTTFNSRNPDTSMKPRIVRCEIEE